ncbi:MULTISPECIES: hypothetical protein [Streptomyces]|nr:hypothetical protein [Streptomyces sp. NEAU-383]
MSQRPTTEMLRGQAITARSALLPPRGAAPFGDGHSRRAAD